MSRLSNKWIVAIAVAVMFSLAPMALAQKGGQSCATADLKLARTDKSAVTMGETVDANEALDASGIVTSCSKAAEKFTAEAIVTDSTGIPTTVASATFKLRGGATAQAIGNFIAGDFLAAGSTSGTVTVTGRILSSDGNVVDSKSISFTVTRY